MKASLRIISTPHNKTVRIKIVSESRRDRNRVSSIPKFPRPRSITVDPKRGSLVIEFDSRLGKME